MPPTPNPEPRPPGSGFTLVELMVAMSITVILGMVVVMAYNTSMQSYYRTEKQLQALAAFRNTADRLEREVNSMVVKASLYPHPIVSECQSGTSSCRMRYVLWDTRAKYINGDACVNGDPYAWIHSGPNPGPGGIGPVVGSATPSIGSGDYWKVNTVDSGYPNAGKSIYQVNFRPHYMGYYSTQDGFTIDRTEWYFNPPEEKRFWADGEDNDHDDPDRDAGLRILYDDRGCLMFRKTFDEDMVWREWDTTAGSPNNYRDSYHGPYSRSDFPPLADEQAGPLTSWDADGDGDVDNDDLIDTGTVIGEGFSDLRFYYLYKLRTSDKFIYAKWWPWDNDNDPTNTNGLDATMPKKTITTYIGGSWNLPHSQWDITGCTTRAAGNIATKSFDISYFTLPLAISVKFSFRVGRQKHVYEKLIYLHASRWLKYLNP